MKGNLCGVRGIRETGAGVRGKGGGEGGGLWRWGLVGGEREGGVGRGRGRGREGRKEG